MRRVRGPGLLATLGRSPVCRVTHTPDPPLQGTRRGVGSEGQRGDWEGAVGWGAERASGGQGSTGWARRGRPAPVWSALFARAREATQGVGPARAARWRQSPRVPAAPSLGAEVKPSAGEAAGSQGCILGSRLGSLRGKLFSVEILKLSNMYQSRAKANPVSPMRVHPCLPTHFIFKGNSQTSNHFM